MYKAMPTIRTYINACRVSKIMTRESADENNENGFSLIEILVVVLLIAIMSAIVASNWRTPSETIDKKAAVSVTMDYKAAIEEYRQDHHGEAPAPGCNSTAPGAWQEESCDGSLNAGPIAERKE